MLPSPLDLIPGTGPGPLRFGMRAEQVRQMLGAPSAEQEHDGGRLVLAYEPGLDLAFREPYGLVSITVHPPAGDVRLWGEPVFGTEPEALLRGFQDRGMGIERTEPDGWGDWSCTIPGAGVILYFAEDEGLQAVEMFVGRWDRGEMVAEPVLPEDGWRSG